MTAEEIFAGESDNVEFKSEIPAKSEKYMKTVVAFANGKGGKLIFGVENGTWAVTGFSKEEVFQKMDAITNAIFDSCEPKITPNIAVQEIDGKAVIVVGHHGRHLYPRSRYNPSCGALPCARTYHGGHEPLFRPDGAGTDGI